MIEYLNSNGNKYIELSKKGDYYLLLCVKRSEYVVAWRIVDNGNDTISWGGGSYWNDLEGAYNRFKEKISDTEL